ncbi:MAG: PAS/PAC sensor hybrid histidine kinase [Bacteroidetes bacterium]|nr:MAG: PAS/PAC sensor hybrid histidine kinase [Bacteroidota bacterium]
MRLLKGFYDLELLAERAVFLAAAITIPFDALLHGAFAAGSPENPLNRVIPPAVALVFFLLSLTGKFNKRFFESATYIVIGLFMLQIGYLNHVYRFNANESLLLVAAMLLFSLYFSKLLPLVIYLSASMMYIIAVLQYTPDAEVDPDSFIPRFMMGVVIAFILSRAGQIVQEKLRLSRDELQQKNKELEEVRGKLESTLNFQQRLSLVADRTTNAVIITDSSDCIEWVNEGFTRITGYTVEESKGRTLEFLRGAATDPETVKRIGERLLLRKPFVDEILNYRKNGTPVWLHIHVTPILDDAGKLVRCVSIQEDVTEQKRVEEELRHSREQLNMAQRLAQMGHWELQPRTQQFQASEETARMFGVEDTGRIDAAIFRSRIHPDDIDMLDKVLKATLKRRSPFEIDLRIIVGGQLRHIYMIGEAIAGKDGNTEKIFGTVQDITERKRIEEELRLTELRFRKLFENSQLMIISHGFDGRIFSINASGAHALGYEPEELIGYNVRNYMAPKTQAIFEKYTQDIIRAGQMGGTMTLMRRDGSEGIWIFRSIVLDDSDGNPYILGSCLDITERYEMENELKKAKDVAEKALVAKDRFVANISHEIRTPMNAIIGFTDVLLGTELDREQYESIDAVRSAGENLLAIINDLLDLSKIEAGKLQFEERPMNLREVMGDVHKLLSYRSADRLIEFTWHCDEQVPQYILGDSLKLNQVLINLVGNAIKFTEKGFVRFDCSMIWEDSENCMLRFRVEDSGIGIPQEKTDLIFEPFTQASSDSNRKYGGTGLGLSIARDLVELQGGSIGVESAPGKGSLFTFTLPAKKINPGTVREVEQAMLPDHVPADIRVLLVEDHPLNQQLAKKLIIDFGFAIDIAANGRAAVEMLRAEKYDVVLMDLQMPEMDGYEATQFIRNEMKLDVPIVALTAHSIAGERDKCLKMGMNDYLSKPFRSRDLYFKITSNTMKYRKLHTPGIPGSITEIITPGMTPLQELAAGDVNFEREMIAMLLRSMPDDYNNLQEALKSFDHKKVKSLAHRMKSSVAMIGAKTYAGKLEEMEKLAQSADLKTLLERNIVLRAEQEEIMEYLISRETALKN